MSDVERRMIETEAAELRVEEGDVPRLEGYAAVFGARADLGYFSEEIAPGAFSSVLGDDVRALFNHSPDHILGRTRAGTLRIAQDDRGLRYEVDLNPDDQDAMRLHAQIRRGDVTGSSFSFTVAEESWDYEQEPAHRTIMRLEKLLDVAPVVFPAYDAAVVSARAKEAAERELPLGPPAYDWERHERLAKLRERSYR